MSKKVPKIDKFFKEEFKIMQETMPAIWYDVKLKILELQNFMLIKPFLQLRKLKNN